MKLTFLGTRGNIEGRTSVGAYPVITAGVKEVEQETEEDPEHDPQAPPRRVYEIRLYEHHGRPGYWS
jgi:hypothetical protein